MSLTDVSWTSSGQLWYWEWNTWDGGSGRCGSGPSSFLWQGGHQLKLCPAKIELQKWTEFSFLSPNFSILIFICPSKHFIDISIRHLQYKMQLSLLSTNIINQITQQTCKAFSTYFFREISHYKSKIFLGKVLFLNFVFPGFNLVRVWLGSTQHLQQYISTFLNRSQI